MSRGLTTCLVALSACFGRSDGPTISSARIQLDLSEGSFTSTVWNGNEGWLQLAGSALDPASPGLAGYYQFDELTDAISHGATFDAGLIGDAAVFDGTTWLELPHRSSYASSDLTISLWVRPAEFQGTVLAKDGTGNESSNFELSLESAWDTFVLDVETPSASTLESLSHEAQEERWYHLAVALGQSGTQLYVDGSLVDESSTATDPTVNDWPIIIGAAGHDSLPDALEATDHFRGRVDEVSIWSRRLTANDVRALRDDGAVRHGEYVSPVLDAGSAATWTTLSWLPNRPTMKEMSMESEVGYGAGHISADGCIALFHFDEHEPGSAPGGMDVVDAAGNHHGAVSGARLGVPGRFLGALELDGDGDFVDLGLVNTFGSELTLAAWVLAASDIEMDARIISKAVGDGAEDHTWMVSLIDVEHHLRVRLKIDGTTAVIVSDTARVAPNEWTHIAVTYDGSEARIYKNGRVRDVDLVEGSLTAEPAVPAAIGANPDGTHSWHGQIDEVSIWQRALSADEIANLFNRGGLRTRLQVRFCQRQRCDGDFVGPDGTPDTFFSELLTPGPDLPRVELLPVRSRYVQVRVELDSDDNSFSPELRGIEIESL